MQSHSKCLVRHILLGQNIVSSVRAWACKNPIANGEVQHRETWSPVHPVKPGITAGTCRHGVNWSSSRTLCCREAWEHEERGDCFSPHLLHDNVSLIKCSVVSSGGSTGSWLCLHGFSGLVVPIPFGTAAGFTQSWTGYTTGHSYKCLFPNLQHFCQRQTPLWMHLGQLLPAPPRWWHWTPRHLELKQHML